MSTTRARRPKAADVTDGMFLDALRLAQAAKAENVWAGHESGGIPVSRWDLAEHLGFPEKVVLAKAKALLRRGAITGCGCGCRGDFRAAVRDDPITPTTTQGPLARAEESP